nr:hypothetical protein [Tanacetum cinerariifolium]
MDDPLIFNEVISWCRARKEQLLMFKVDFQKAFTRLGGIILTTFLASLVSESNGVGRFVVVFNLLKLRFWSTARQRMNFLLIEGYGKEILFLPSFLSSSWRVCMFLFKGSSIEMMAKSLGFVGIKYWLIKIKEALELTVYTTLTWRRSSNGFGDS